MNETDKKKPHAIARINRLPRLLAVYSYVLVILSHFGLSNLGFSASLACLLGLVWPFVSFWLSSIMGTKRQEILNMYIDSAFTACSCLILLSPMVVFSVVIVLSANALFTGFFKLLASCFAIFLTTLFSGMWLLDVQWVEVSSKTNTLIMMFLMVYFSFFAFMGYKLLKNFLLLNKKIHELSIKDPLTGGYNRFYLDKELPREINRCMRMEYPLVLIFADIDFFKKINDTLGHSGGDDVLKIFVKILNECIREEFDWVARFGGEEFVVVLANSNTENGMMVAERMRKSVEDYNFSINGENIKVTSSFGVTGVNKFDGVIDADTLLDNADKGLYAAKENGRNRIEEMVLIQENTGQPDDTAATP